MSEEELKNARQNLKTEELNLLSTIINRDYTQAQVDTDIIKKQMIAQLRQMNIDVERMKSNVQVLKKQIRVKKYIRLIPPDKK